MSRKRARDPYEAVMLAAVFRVQLTKVVRREHNTAVKLDAND